MDNLSDKHVVISGGGSGVGEQLAAQFASSGAKVTILGRRQSKLDTVAAATGALPIICDVTDASSVESAMQSARSQHGAISISIANAGSAISKPFASTTANDSPA